MVPVGFSTQVRHHRAQVDLNGINGKARGINLSLASDATAKLNGSNHQETAKVKTEESSGDVAMDSSALAAPVAPDEKQEQPPPSNSISLSAIDATNEKPTF